MRCWMARTPAGLGLPSEADGGAAAEMPAWTCTSMATSPSRSIAGSQGISGRDLQPVPQGVPDAVDGQHREYDRDTGSEGHRGRDADELVRRAQRVSPARRRRLDADAQEA